MSISNEVVKFIAEIELDAQDRENFLQGLKECDKECSDLRDGILHLQNSLTKLRTEGKEDTKEFKALQAVLDSKTKTLKETTKQADKYSSALGASRMSMNQLKKYAKELQSAMNNMHKESNPEQWAKYEKELKTVNDRIKELKNGSAGAKKGMSSMLEDIANGFTIANIALKGFSALADLAKKGWQSFTQETQVWGDWWQMKTTKINAGWSQFIANLGQGKDVIKASVADAVQAAAEAQLLYDELFERENSLKIISVKTPTEINNLMAEVKDSTLPESVRLKKIDLIIEKEKISPNLRADLRLRPGIPGHGWHHQAMFSPKLCLSVPIFPFRPTFWVPTGTESSPTLPVGPVNQRFHLIPLIGQCQHTFFLSLAAVRSQWIARR